MIWFKDIPNLRWLCFRYQDGDDDDYEDYDEEGFVVASGGSSSSASGAVGGSSNPAVVTKNVMGVHAVSGGGGGARRKAWDDEHVLKRKFSALIPAFDPRPGRTNVPQTSDIEIAAPVASVAVDENNSSSSALPVSSVSPPPEEGKVSPILDPSQPKLQLCLRGPNLPGIVDVEIDLNEPEWTIFRAVQYVMQVRYLTVIKKAPRSITLAQK